MNLPDSPTLQFLIQYGYWFAIPIMIIEGPIATIVMAFFASFGYFNPFVVLFFSFFSDLISDSGFYAIGRYNGSWFTRKFGKYFNINDNTYGLVQNFFGSRLEGDFSNISQLITGTGLVFVCILAFLILYQFYFHKILEKKWKLAFSNGKNSKDIKMEGEQGKTKTG